MQKKNTLLSTQIFAYVSTNVCSLKYTLSLHSAEVFYNSAPNFGTFLYAT